MGPCSASAEPAPCVATKRLHFTPRSFTRAGATHSSSRGGLGRAAPFCNQEILCVNDIALRRNAWPAWVVPLNPQGHRLTANHASIRSLRACRARCTSSWNCPRRSRSRSRRLTSAKRPEVERGTAGRHVPLAVASFDQGFELCWRRFSASWHGDRISSAPKRPRSRRTSQQSSNSSVPGLSTTARKSVDLAHRARPRNQALAARSRRRRGLLGHVRRCAQQQRRDGRACDHQRKQAACDRVR